MPESCGDVAFLTQSGHLGRTAAALLRPDVFRKCPRFPMCSYSRWVLALF